MVKRAGALRRLDSQQQPRAGEGAGMKPLFIECIVCGERWKVATIPVPLGRLSKVLRSCMCPTCGETKRIVMCPTDGVDAVTEPRAGMPQ